MQLGKGIIEDPKPFLDYVLADALDHPQWPEHAVFKISYRTKSWPEHAMGGTFHRYFATAEEVKAWEVEYSQWANLGNNSVEYTVYAWDVDPIVVKHNWY